MLKKLVSVCVFACSLLFLQSTAAFAGHCGCEKMTHKMHKVVQGLDLSNEQKEKLKEIMASSRDAMKVKHDEMRDVRVLVNGAFKDGSMTEPKIDEFSNKLQQIVGAMMKIRMMERFEIAKVLTDEQKEKLYAELQKMHEDHHNKQCHGEKDGKHPAPVDE